MSSKPVTPATWGPYAWTASHFFTVFYPDDPSYAHRKAAVEYFHALPYLLPCKVCADEFRSLLVSDPVEPHVENRTKLALWFFNVHNQVNKRLGKPEFSMKQFIAAYSNPDSTLLPIGQNLKSVRVSGNVDLHGGDSGTGLKFGFSESVAQATNSGWFWFFLGVLATFAWFRFSNRHVAK